jgi:phosphinothricin acetyltransferase
MGVGPVLRSARPDDAAAIAEIYAPYVRDTVISFEVDPPGTDEMRQRMTHTLQTYPWLVVEEVGEVVGYAYASQHRSREAYRWACDVAVYLHPKAQGQGYGSRLYSELLLILKRQGLRAAFGGIALPNPASVALHEKMGFRHLGTYSNVGFKHGGWHDVGWWQLQIGAHDGVPDEITPFSKLDD